MRLCSYLLAVGLLLPLACSDDNPSAGGTGNSTTGDSTTGNGDGDGDGDPTTGDGDPTTNDCAPTLESLRDDIFTPSCALMGCHASADKAGGLDLGAADLEAQLVGAPAATCDGWVRVIPATPDESLLYLKIANMAPCGAPMPPPNGLDAGRVACVRTWIENLDPVNCETCGGDACVDLDTDPDHCGTCGNTCPANIACIAGECTCPDGLDLCGDTCLDTNADAANCGGCGLACAPNKVCWQGVCADTCADLTDCNGGCVDTNADPNNCGVCGNVCEGGNACEMGSCNCPGNGVSFAAEIEPLLASTCSGLGCHGFPAPAAGLDLRAGQSYGALVGVPSSQCGNRMRVAPGQPGASYLVDKLAGINLCFGTQMPKAAPPLSAAQQDTISEWICRGAMDN